MLYFDVTKTFASRHSSGLTRVSRRLLAELQRAEASGQTGGQVARGGVTPVVWRGGAWRDAQRRRQQIAFAPGDRLFTAELFSEAERPGISAFIDAHPCRLAAVFHDAIPLRFPEITWPQSVQRAPGYMKLLARFDRVLAVSRQSVGELEAFWKWQGGAARAEIALLPLGADFMPGVPRGAAAQPPHGLPARDSAKTDATPSLLCVGILEPRKNQSFLLDVCEMLWNGGLRFDLHIAGRVNPHFGAPVKDKIKRLRKKHRGLHWHENADDASLLALYRGARAVVFPTIAEGCGLPPLEALWLGVPCVCSDLPVLREYADDGGCVPVPVNDAGAWAAALRRMLTDDAESARLRAEAASRALPAWADTAAAVRALPAD